MTIILGLSKACKSVDKYEAIDAQGNIIKENPPVGPTYIDKKICQSAAQISITIAIVKK